MLNWTKALGCLFALGLAGCASNPQRRFTRVPDWESEEARTPPASTPAPATAPAPTPTPAPTPPVPALPPPKSRPAETWIPLQRWCAEKGLATPTKLPDAPMPAYAIKSASGTLTLHAKNQAAQWDRLELRLGFAPQMIDGQLFVHTLDLSKTVEPILVGRKMKLPENHPVIVIDPGHGGENAGAKSVLGNRYEKEFTLDWARRTAALLSSNGWQVFLTRTNDSDLALSNRVAFAEEHKAGLFLSLHFNSAAPSEEQAGLETYCLTPVGMPSTVTREFSDEPSTVYANNAFDSQNILFAFQIHRALVAVNGTHDRGVRRARFPGVLQGQQRPAILVEGGYLSNPREAAQIASPLYRQKLATAIADALGKINQASEVEIRPPNPADPKARSSL